MPKYNMSVNTSYVLIGLTPFWEAGTPPWVVLVGKSITFPVSFCKHGFTVGGHNAALDIPALGGGGLCLDNGVHQRAEVFLQLFILILD